MNRLLKNIGFMILGAFILYCLLWGKLIFWDLPNAWDKIYVPTNGEKVQ